MMGSSKVSLGPPREFSPASVASLFGCSPSTVGAFAAQPLNITASPTHPQYFEIMSLLGFTPQLHRQHGGTLRRSIGLMTPMARGYRRSPLNSARRELRSTNVRRRRRILLPTRRVPPHNCGRTAAVRESTKAATGVKSYRATCVGSEHLPAHRVTFR